MAYDLINIGTPNGNNGDTIRDAFKKSNDNDAYLKQKVEEFAGGLPGVVSNNEVTILTPLDAQLSLYNSSVTGAIMITLPNSWTETILKLYVEIYDSLTDESISLIISGGNMLSFGNSWWGTSVQIITTKANKNLSVRFGHNGTKSCIYIGELNSDWHHIKCFIKKAFFSHSSYQKELWLTGWNISLETSSFQNISRTNTNNLPIAQ